MRSRSVSFFRALLLALLSATSLAAVAADPVRPLAPIDPDDFVFERTQVDWSQAYLQWIAAFPRDASPVSDATGALCAARQEGDVWFLATSSGGAPVERQCSVPSGKTLFVPIAVTVERSGNKVPDCGSMARIAVDHLGHVTDLSMTLDGLAVFNLERQRQPTGDCFALGLRQVPRSTSKTTVADGWYVMLPPLPPGPHTLVVGARYDATRLATTYRLDVH
jgi:hypothetical protein